MPVWKLQCSWAADSALPRDRLVITPHVNDGGVGSDPQGLCDDLLAALTGWQAFSGEVSVRAYDAQGTVPVYPAGSAVANSGLFQARDVIREVALCLSFYSERNIPRRRGRLYLPLPLIGAAPGIRPTAGHFEAASGLATILQELGGPDVDWCVYSRTDDVARPVTNWWVDNEWDVQRSRGLRATARTTGTTSEA
jgi:hypothetical protein